MSDQCLLQFHLLSNRGVLATAYAIVENKHPLTARTLCDRYEHARRCPARTLRAWLLALYHADLVRRVRKRRSWHYWAGEQLPELLRIARVSGSMFRSPRAPDPAPADDHWAADGPDSLGM